MRITRITKCLFESLTLLAFIMLAYGCAETPVKPSLDDGLATHHKSSDRLLKKYLHEQCRTLTYSTLDSIVRVATLDIGGGDASGIVVAPNLVLTAAHVLEGQQTGLVYIGRQYKAAIVLGADPGSDLALLSVGTEALIPIAIGKQQLQVRESVWAVGYPLARHQTTTEGEFFNYRNGGLLTSAAIDAGSSGGGLLHCENGQFKLAGMIRSYMAYYRHGERVMLPERSISVPADAIQAFINLHGIEL